MQERALRKVLLIQAIEETDRRGEALPLAERAEATRAVGGNNMSAVETQPEAQLSSATEWFLARRADLLLRSLRERSPGVDHVLTVAGGATSLDRLVLVFSFAAGVLLSFLDGGGRGINIFALPLITLLFWNLLVYASMLTRWRKSLPGSSKLQPGPNSAKTNANANANINARAPRLSLFAGVYSRWARTRIDTLLGHSTHFNAPLAPGLRRFAGDWWEVAKPLFAIKARRLLHWSAAVVALGLIVGYYLRGFILRSTAGWEGGDIVGSGSARTLLAVLYGPASVISGIPIPDTHEIEGLRQTAATASGGGGDSAPWIHLIAWTAGLYIVLPRMLAALTTSFNLWRLSRRLVLPSGTVGYVRTLFAAEKIQPENGEPHDV